MPSSLETTTEAGEAVGEEAGADDAWIVMVLKTILPGAVTVVVAMLEVTVSVTIGLLMLLAPGAPDEGAGVAAVVPGFDEEAAAEGIAELATELKRGASEPLG